MVRLCSWWCAGPQRDSEIAVISVGPVVPACVRRGQWRDVVLVVNLKVVKCVCE